MLRCLCTVIVAIALVTPWSTRALAQTPTSSDTSTTSLQAPPPPATPPTGPDFPRGRISGYMFGDVYWNADGDPRHAYGPGGVDSGKVNIDNSGKPITRDLNGVQFRRIYFQLDNDLSIRLSTRFRLEADSRSLSSDGKIGVYVKNAYLQARNLLPRADFLFGMQDTPTFVNAEDFWSYRSIEKMMADFQGISSSSDLGVGLKGFVDPNHHIGYWALIGDGTFQRPENNRDKRFYLSLPLRVGDLRVEPYADYENGPQATDRATYQLFVGFEPPHSAIGVQALDRVNHRASGGNTEPRGLSVFARWAPRPDLGTFARVDFWQPDHRADDRVDTRLWMAGIDWQPIKDVHVMPNLEGQMYDAQGTAVAPADHDLQARITFYYRYSKPQS